jgi:hypothetical protein
LKSERLGVSEDDSVTKVQNPINFNAQKENHSVSVTPVKFTTACSENRFGQIF